MITFIAVLTENYLVGQSDAIRCRLKTDRQGSEAHDGQVDRHEVQTFSADLTYVTYRRRPAE